MGGEKKMRGRREGRRKIKKDKILLGIGIYNISGTNLWDDGLRVLDKGLKFAPVRNFNKFQTYVNLQKFVSTLNSKKIFFVQTR